MKIAVTGLGGFIGSNLKKALELKGHAVVPLRLDEVSKVSESDVIIHLAGVNKGCANDMLDINVHYTLRLMEACNIYKKKLICAGSLYGKKDHYGLSKEIAENALLSYVNNFGCDFYSVKTPRVVGKGCKPFYNSFVTTMAYLHSRGDNSYMSQIDDLNKTISLIWVDDLCNEFCDMVEGNREYFPVHVPKDYFILDFKEILHAFNGKPSRHSAKFTDLINFYKSYEIKHE